MKTKLILLIVGLIVSLSANAQTWIIHNWKDNSTLWWFDTNIVSIVGPEQGYVTTGWEYAAAFYTDWASDQVFPLTPASQYYSGALQPTGTYLPNAVVGYSAVYTITVPTGTLGSDLLSEMGGFDEGGYIEGGYPDYGDSGLGDFHLSLGGGEFWVDFSPSGIARVSNTKLSDFGKWSWDGSINPNWVEPLAAPSLPGKRLAKGHAK